MPHFSNQSSAAETDTSLLSAPGAGKQLVIDMLFVSSDTAQTITFESGTATRKWEFYVGANGGMLVADSDLFRCADNEALTYTTSATAESFVSGKFRIMNTTQA